jgi:hypothetical protein
MGPDLFRLDGINFYPEKEHVLSDAPEHMDMDRCFLRCERQSLKCLLETGVIVFCVRTCVTPLAEIVRRDTDWIGQTPSSPCQSGWAIARSNRFGREWCIRVSLRMSQCKPKSATRVLNNI